MIIISSANQGGGSKCNIDSNSKFSDSERATISIRIRIYETIFSEHLFFNIVAIILLNQNKKFVFWWKLEILHGGNVLF